MRKKMLVLLAVTVIPAISHALSYSTQENSFLRQISMLFEQYEKKHGSYPLEWKELNSIYGEPNWSLDETFEYIRPSESYRFVMEELTLPFDDTEYGQDYVFKALLISNGPIRDIRLNMGLFGTYTSITEKKYFALIEGPEGAVTNIQLSPETVVQRYQTLGLKMPDPVELPERKWVRKARFSMTMRYAAYIILGFIVAYPAFRLIKKGITSR